MKYWKLTVLATACVALQGCSAAIGLGVAGAQANMETDNNLRLSKMNCSGLRAEYSKKRSEFLGAASANAVLERIKAKGCRLPG
jgi:hypothetical protein